MGFNFFKSFTEPIKPSREDKRLEKEEAEEYSKNITDKSEDITEKGRNLPLKEKIDGFNDREEWREEESRLKKPTSFRTENDVQENEQIYGEDLSAEDKIYKQANESLGYGEADPEKSEFESAAQAKEEEKEISEEWKRDAWKFLRAKEAKQFISFLDRQEKEAEAAEELAQLSNRIEDENENENEGKNEAGNKKGKDFYSVMKPSSTPPSDIVSLFKKINRRRIEEAEKAVAANEATAGKNESTEPDIKGRITTPNKTTTPKQLDRAKLAEQRKIKEIREELARMKQDRKGYTDFEIDLMAKAYNWVKSSPEERKLNPVLDAKNQSFKKEDILELANEYGEYQVSKGDWGKGTFELVKYPGGKEKLVCLKKSRDGHLKKYVIDSDDDPGSYFFDLTDKKVARLPNKSEEIIFVKSIPDLLPIQPRAEIVRGRGDESEEEGERPLQERINNRLAHRKVKDKLAHRKVEDKEDPIAA